MIGQTISHYRILEKIGGGGMGVVYRAEDTKLKRTVALKFLPPDLTRDPEAKKRFIHEAQAASALQHNNICTVHDIDETADGQVFIVMDCYEGETLKKKIERQPLPIGEAIEVAIQIARGLAKAHESGVVHRDIKPANIMVTKDSEAKIVDFGLAKLVGQTKLTRTGSTLGTMVYMSPEQVRGEEVDHRSDIWSLGVVLYEMITGRPPFRGDYQNAVVYSIINADIEPLTALRTGVPKEMERIVTKALAKDPGQRYQHIDDLSVDLSRIHAESQHSAIPSLPKRRIPPSKRPLMALAAALIVMGIAAGAWLLGKDEGSGFTYDRWKSVGVLPFVPMNKTSDDSIFADGIHDDILTQLSKISDLRVIARTSMVVYRDTKKRMNEIGDELDVGYLLEGSVRRAAGRLRITAQLINAKTEGHVWANVYERDESDLFAIQSEIATRIAEELDLRLSPSEKSSIETPMTSSLTARDFYAKGQYYWASYADSAGNAKAAEMFDSASSHDPRFAEAFAYASVVHGALYVAEFDLSPQRLDKTKSSLKRAIELAPNLPEVRYAKGMYYHWIERDKHKAMGEYEAALKNKPKWHELLLEIGILCQESGDPTRARDCFRRMRAIDPMGVISGGWEPFLVSARLREWDVARREVEDYLVKHPEDPLPYYWMSIFLIDGYGDLKRARAVLEEASRKPPYIFRGGASVTRRSFWRIELYERRYDSALACLPDNDPSLFYPKAITLLAQGSDAAAHAYFDSARVVQEQTIRNGKSLWLHINEGQLGLALAGLGKREESIAHIQKALDAFSHGPTMDLFRKQELEADLALAYIWLGMHDKAIDLIEDLLRRPGTLTVWKLRLSPLYDPLRNDPRFQKLMSGD